MLYFFETTERPDEASTIELTHRALERARRFAPIIRQTGVAYGLDNVSRTESTLIALSAKQVYTGASAGATLSSESVRYKLRVARTDEQMRIANELVEKLYGARGYSVQVSAELETALPKVCILIYDSNNRPVGTGTASFGNPIALCADELYSQEIDNLRRTGCRVMEMTRLAIDGHGLHSPRIHAALINVAYICGKLAGFNHVVIEVNPKHVGYYQNCFGFHILGEERCCPRVSAPAILLGLGFDQIRNAIARAKSGASDVPRTNLYRHFLDSMQEKTLTQQLITGQTACVSPQSTCRSGQARQTNGTTSHAG